MKPLTPHWADIAAARVVQTWGDQDTYTIASGITPSGTVHIGNFREVITVDLVGKALKSLGKNVRFIYSWDDFDTLRKIPENFPNKEMLKEHMRRPISRVPDPWGKVGSYAEANESSFETELKRVGIAPEFIYQNKKYSQGVYAESMRHALKHTAEIKEILDAHRTEPLPESWLPTAIYCEACDRDTIENESFDGEWSYSYACTSCGHKATTDIRTTKNLKLNWRTDWPMRWAFEKVHFEPGGKDHSSEGGSFDTGAKIIKKIWDRPAPNYVQYDFVSIKGSDGKMSSSKGHVITLGEALKIYSPEIVRWIFAVQRLNHDFALAFDQDVIKCHDEYDRAEQEVYSEGARSNPKLQASIRAYDLAQIGRLTDKTRPPFRPSFRELCNRLQSCSGDMERVAKRFYAESIRTEDDKWSFKERCRCALNWLHEFAPQDFRYSIQTERVDVPCSDSVQKAVGALRTLIEATDLETISSQDFNQKIYDSAIKDTGVDAKDFFRVVYQKLIARDQGPRLPGFLIELGKEKALELL